MKKLSKSVAVAVLFLITIVIQGLTLNPAVAENNSGDIEKSVNEIEQQILDYKFGTALENAKGLTKNLSDSFYTEDFVNGIL